jgi:hypothetical protein
MRHVWGTKRVLAGKEATWKAHVDRENNIKVGLKID